MWTGLGWSFAVTRPVRTGLDWYIYYIIHKKYKKYKLNIIKVWKEVGLCERGQVPLRLLRCK
jgi:hypothetical protein